MLHRIIEASVGHLLQLKAGLFSALDPVSHDFVWMSLDTTGDGDSTAPLGSLLLMLHFSLSEKVLMSNLNLLIIPLNYLLPSLILH